MKRLLLAIIVLLISLNVSAQKPLKDIPISDLKAPSAPAYTVIGAQPNEISRPKDFKALEASFVNAFTSGDGFAIPKDFAVEFTPYWFTKHPNLTLDNWIDQDRGWESVMRNFSISVATSDDQRDTIRNSTQIGFGARTYLISGKMNSDAVKNLALYNAVTNQQMVYSFWQLIIFNLKQDNTISSKSAMIAAIDNAYNGAKNSGSLTPDKIRLLDNYKLDVIDPFLDRKDPQDNADVKNVLTELQNLINKTGNNPKYVKLANELQDVLYNRVGFILEVAGAYGLRVPGNSVDEAQTSEWGMWMTATYRFPKANWDLIAVMRYVQQVREPFLDNNLDIGFRVSTQRNKFSASAEGLFRYKNMNNGQTTINGQTFNLTTKEFDYRLTANMEYKLSHKLALTASLGKNFGVNPEARGDLISMLGLNVGLGGINFGDIKL